MPFNLNLELERSKIAEKMWDTALLVHQHQRHFASANPELLASSLSHEVELDHAYLRLLRKQELALLLNRLALLCNPSNKGKVIGPNDATPDMDAVRIDRGTPWGNPFRISEFGRAKALENYLTEVAVFTDLEPLRGKVLICGCKSHGPGTACHGDVILDLLHNGPWAIRLKSWAESLGVSF